MSTTETYVPSLLATDVEDDVRASVRTVLARRSSPAGLTAMYDGAEAPAVWPDLVGVGAAALLIDEERGGAGAGVAVAGVIAEEIGAACASTPLITSAVTATATLIAAGDVALLPGLAAGERIAALALPFSTSPHGVIESTIEVRDGLLTGGSRSVAGALGADLLLVLADDGALYAVDASDDGVVVDAVGSLDQTRPVADVTLNRATGARIADVGGPAVRTGLRTGAAVLASEQAGIARWCVETTVDYLKQRRQFGRVVGGFQAIKHRLAELYADCEAASAAARAATVTTADLGPDHPESVITTTVAAAYCSDLAVRAAEEALQLHGGIGMTWEHPAHLYLKRAKADQIGLGTAGAHRAALAALADLPAPPIR